MNNVLQEMQISLPVGSRQFLNVNFWNGRCNRMAILRIEWSNNDTAEKYQKNLFHGGYFIKVMQILKTFIIVFYKRLI